MVNQGAFNPFAICSRIVFFDFFRFWKVFDLLEPLKGEADTSWAIGGEIKFLRRSKIAKAKITKKNQEGRKRLLRLFHPQKALIER